MSTKVTKHYGRDFHIYKECFYMNKGIYIQLEKLSEYNVSYSSEEECSTLTFLIKDKTWEEIKKKIIDQYEKEKREKKDS